MCGVAGIVDLRAERDIDPQRLRAMTEAIAHRGPDGEGAVIEPGLAIGHRRLSIIDLKGGAQPFETADKNGVLSFNGEIYNFVDLRTNAPNRAYRTRSDTEVLAEGLAAIGADFVHSLRGMFGFAYWDRKAQELLLVRDRLGEKPLYYAETADGCLVFASEIRAVLASGLLDDAFDEEAVADYFLYGYVPDPKTIYRSVRKLRPGERLIAPRGGTPRLERYWRASYALAEAPPFEAAAGDLMSRLDNAVRAQLVSDVPLGAFLSGGVDSSAIASSMALQGRRAQVCTVGFDNAAADERVYARQVAERYGLDQTEEVMSLDAASLIPRIAQVYGEPFADSSALPTYRVCEAARRMVTVALSGDGGDEAFVGYRRYPMFAAEARARDAIPAHLRRLLFAPAGAIYPKLDWAPRFLRAKTTLQALGEEPYAAYARAAGLNLPERIAKMMSGDFKRTLGGYEPASVVEEAAKDIPPEVAADPVRYAQAIDLETWLPGRMLTKVDRASMAHGLEVRTPFLDPELVAWANGLPTDYKLKDGVGKRVLKRAMEPRLPHEILYRPKQGFALPVREWLRAKGGPLDALLASTRWREDGRFDAAAVDRMVARHRARAADYSQEVWTLMMWDGFLGSH